MNKKMIRTRNLWLAMSIITAVFGAVYEMFSHQVYSGFMIFAFLIPLIFGFLPSAILAGRASVQRQYDEPLMFYYFGIVTLTFGSVFRGILQIYGTTSHLEKYYWIAGAALVTAGFLTGRMGRKDERAA